MRKFKFIIPILLSAILVLVGASCGEKGNEDGKISRKKGIFTLAEKGVPSSKDSLKVSGDGYVVYFFDSDEDGKTDSIVKSDPNGNDKKIIKIKPGLLESDVQIDDGVLAVDDKASKVVFSATPPSERGEYGGEKHLYVLDVAAETVKKLPNQNLADQFEGAGWADPQAVSISSDGEKIAFGIRVWGIDLGMAVDVANAIAVINSDGTGLKMLAEKSFADKEEDNISVYVVGIDDSDRVFFAKEQSKYNWILFVINADGSGEKNLELNINTSKISVSNNGTIAGTLNEKDDPAFACDANGNILAKGGNPWGAVEISENGKKVSSAEWDQGLFLYDVDNNFEKENILDKSYGNCAVHDVDNSGQVIACRLHETGEVIVIVK